MNRSITLSRLALVALSACILGLSCLAQAQKDSKRFTAAEVASLPPYCQDRLNQKRNKERWQSQFGPEIYLHIHHFCYGLIYYSRASMEPDKRERLSAAQNALGNFNYVLKNWPANTNSQLYPQAQMYKQQVEFIIKLK